MKLRNIIYSVVAVSTLALTSCSDSYLDDSRCRGKSHRSAL